MMNREWLSLYLVTDRGRETLDTLIEKTEKAIRGGVTMVQLREKNADSQSFYHAALHMKKLCERYGVPLLINDRADIALAVGANGVHVGQRDIPVKALRAILPEHMIIGVTANTQEGVATAALDGADYVGAGAVFPTITKQKPTIIGMDGLRDLCATTSLPIVAIGGITEQNAADVRACGPDGIAVSGAILKATCPQEASGNLL